MFYKRKTLSALILFSWCAFCISAENIDLKQMDGKTLYVSKGARISVKENGGACLKWDPSQRKMAEVAFRRQVKTDPFQKLTVRIRLAEPIPDSINGADLRLIDAEDEILQFHAPLDRKKGTLIFQIEPARLRLAGSWKDLIPYHSPNSIWSN